MSELISAKEFSMNTLERIKYMISVIKIQRTWKVFLERRVAKINKESNTIVFPEDFSGAITDVICKRINTRVSVQIPDWDKMTVSSQKNKKIKFNVFSRTQSHSGEKDIEFYIQKDGIDKHSNIYSNIVWKWIQKDDHTESFFENEGIPWLQEKFRWESYLIQTIKTLDSQQNILLWRNPGITFYLYPIRHSNLIYNLYIIWKLYLNSLKIENIKKRKYNSE